ncbi:BspA family leucine-rich repeat surface protein [Marivirga harenae]|uniref:BspA family leucine-rich repeat surface protein n=1 Tax=Marivirga harenae TaxID=2010992 RepID=UPI0026E000E8|nr:BspA family leucine-rich repeat surface protein [Marivirga harenae]WKV12686.1 BspA family leucine-rich repeat surface protein [Marivirga harenae]
MYKFFCTSILLIFSFAFSGKLSAQNEFTTTWETENGEITIPIISIDSLTYNYDIEWANLTNPGQGDGSDAGISTAYTISGLNNNDTYEIKISGAFPAIYFLGSADAAKIQTIEQWGNIQWETMYFAFYGCTNLISNATDTPNLEQVSSMIGMFALATTFNSDLNNWDVGNVSNFIGVFFNASSFNGNIDDWDLSNATDMRQMFDGATSFNGDLNNWDVSNVIDMSALFRGATSFNGNISNWNTTSAENMSNMFSGATSFNQDVNDWNVFDVLNMSGMFQNAIAFNSELDDWFTGTVTNMTNMFSGASSFDQSLGDWNIGDVTNMTGMLDNCGMSKLNYDATLRGWESSFSTPIGISLGAAGLQYCNAADTRAILTGTGGYSWIINGDNLQCDPFITTWQTTDNEITIPTPTFGADPYAYSISWVNLTTPGLGDGSDSGITGDYTIGQLNNNDIYEVSISGDFPRIYFLNFNHPDERVKILSIEQWGDQEWTNMSNAFYNCVNLVSNASDSPILINATNLNSMFSGATSFTGDLSNWDVSTIEDMSDMFQGASSFNSNLNDWDVSNVTDMNSMFTGASSFNSDLSNWDVGNVNAMFSMFRDATSFNQSLNSWQVNSVNSMSSMFDGASSFNGDISNWSVNNVTSMSRMFKDATSFNGDLSDWNIGNVMYIDEMFANATSFSGDLSDWDVRNVLEMRLMFHGATAFNSDISEWNIAKVQQMGGMFWNATSFNQNLGSWDISSVEPFEEEASPPLGIDSLFTNSGMSTFNYDSTLIGWSTLTAEEVRIPLNLSLGAHGLNFCQSSIERTELIEDFGWTIYDNGPGCPVPTSQASNISFSNVTTSEMEISWTNGNGTNRIVVARAGNAVSSNPTNLTTYSANPSFSDGDGLGSGNFVVYKGNGNSFTLTGLTDGTTYHLRVYEYNGANGLEVYLKSTAVGNPASQTTIAVPNIIDFTPSSAGTADTVTITGSGFTDASLINFGGTNAASFTVLSDTEIEAIVGSGTSGDVLVNTPAGTATQGGFEYIPAPVISSFLPTAAAQGDTVIITGTNFTEAEVVSFGGTVPDTFNIVSDTEIMAIVAEGTSGDVSVTTLGGTATLTGFEFIPAPFISNFSPTSAPEGGTVTIIGLNFTDASVVHFGGTAATSFTLVSDTEISAVVNSGTSGDVLVTTPGGTATQEGFVFIPAPTISSFSPTTAAQGDTVTISGFHFTAASIVSFGGADAESFTVVSDSEINAVLGNGDSGDVAVTTAGGMASQAGFDFIAQPQIISFSPNSAKSGETVEISGSNFTNASAVSFGGIDASSFTVISDSLINATVGSGSSGIVSVITPGGTGSKEGFTLLFSQIALFWGNNISIENNQTNPIDLGKAPIGESIQNQFIILNNGNTDLVISSLSSSEDEFELISTVDTVKSGFPAPITVNFNSTIVGLYETEIRIINNSINSPEFIFPIRAELTGLNIIDDETDSLVISNQDINLGSTLINVNVDKNFNIENLSSTSTIEILSITVDNPVFQIINAPNSIAPSSSEEFTVRLNASAVGEYRGTVTVATNLNDFRFGVEGIVLAELSTDIKVYNVVTPNGDGRHDFLLIDNITEYQNNNVSIFNRLGNRVFEIDNYDNSSRIFEGNSNSGEQLLTGNYYYVIDKGNGEKRISGFLIIKR